MSISTISPQELAEICKAGKTQVIDVRTPAEFQECHCIYAENVPLDRLDPTAIMNSRTNSDTPLYLICRSGSRGKQACEKFLQAGYKNVVNVEGGTLAWDQCQLPVNRGQKMMSLERQVRIAAGILVVLGVVLALLIHPGFMGLSAFVGSGLVFAGLTDTCGMGMLIARMPWNQVTTPKIGCAVVEKRS